MSETDATIETVESKLDRAKVAERNEALSLLRTAKSDLEALDRTAGDHRIGSLATRVDQRLREVERRGQYSGGMGSAMNPGSDEAP